MRCVQIGDVESGMQLMGQGMRGLVLVGGIDGWL